jgi:hypothetical protein
MHDDCSRRSSTLWRLFARSRTMIPAAAAAAEMYKKIPQQHTSNTPTPTLARAFPSISPIEAIARLPRRPAPGLRWSAIGQLPVPATCATAGGSTRRGGRAFRGLRTQLFHRDAAFHGWRSNILCVVHQICTLLQLLIAAQRQA